MSASADLLLATQANGLSEVLRLLQDGADANAADEVGETPLFEAAASGNVDITAALLLHSADPGHKSSHAMTARDLAASDDIKTLLDLFDHAPIDDSARDSALASLSSPMRDMMAERFQQQRKTSDGEGKATDDKGDTTAAAAAPLSEEDSPLLSAVQNNDCSEVERLLSSGVAPNVGDSLGETPLFEASASGNLDIAATLLLHAADPAHRSSSGMLAGDLAADDNMKTLLALFEGRDVKDGAKTEVLDALSQAIRARVTDRLKPKSEAAQVATDNARLESSDSPSQELQPAVASSVPDAASGQESLTEHSMLSAIQTNDLQQVQRLAKEGTDLNVADEAGETPLFEAAANGNLDIAATLLLHAADPAHRSSHGMVATDLAADENMKTLLALFRGVEVKDQAKTAALDVLSETIRAQVFSRLEEKSGSTQPVIEGFALGRSESGAQVSETGAASSQNAAVPADEATAHNVQSSSQAPATNIILSAVQENNLQEVQRLLKEESVDLNAADAAGETPLFEAAAGGNIDIAATLLLHTADPSHKSSHGMVASDLAADENMKNLLALFEGAAVKDEATSAVLDALSETIRARVVDWLQAKNGKEETFAESSGFGKTDSGAQVLESGMAPSQHASVPRTDSATDAQSTKETSPAQVLLSAVQANNLQEVRGLLEKGGIGLNVADAAGETPLFEAAASGNLGIAALLLQHGADPAHRSSHGMVASDLAADENMKTLLALFEGVDVKDQFKIAVLDALSEPIRAQVTSWLQAKNGSPPQAVDGPGSGKSELEAGTLPLKKASTPGLDTARDVQKSPRASDANLILSAVQANNLQEVQSLLKERNVDLNVADAAGETPLFEAAASGNLDIAATLLLHTANPAHKSSHGMVATDLAADENMKALLALFEGVDVKDQAKIAVLDALSETIRTQVVSWLQAKTGSPEPAIDGSASGKHESDVQNLDPGTAPVQSASAQDEDTACDVQSNRETSAGNLILAAVQASNLEEVQRLLQEGNVDLNVADDVGETPLFEAAASGNLDTAALLLLHTADPAHKSSHGMVASDIAADENMKTLLALFEGAEVKDQAKVAVLDSLSEAIRARVASWLQAKSGSPPRVIDESASGKNDSVVQNLETSMAQSQQNASAPKQDTASGAQSGQETSAADMILSAVQSNDLREIHKLLKEGNTDLNVADAAGETPLFEAAAGGNIDIAATLLLHSADPAHKSSHGMLASDLAADENMKTLLALFGGVEVKDQSKAAVLDALSETISAQVMSWLQARNPQPVIDGSATGNNGSVGPRSETGTAPSQNASTPETDVAPDAQSNQATSAANMILTAVQANNLQELQRMLKEGCADLNVADAAGETPLFEAAASGNLDVAATLLLHAADPAHRSSHGMVASDLAADENMKTLLALFEGVAVKDESKGAVVDRLSETVRAQVLTWLQAKNVKEHAVIEESASGKTESGVHTSETGMASSQDAWLQAKNGSSQPVIEESASGQTDSGTQVLETGTESAPKASVPSEEPTPDMQGNQETLAAGALLSAVQDNNLTDVEKLLKEGGMDLNVADAAGETPLFEAAASGNLNIAALLLLHAADPAHKSSHGMVASDLAADENMKTLLAVFEGVEVKDQAKIAVLDALSDIIRAQVSSWLQAKSGSSQPVIEESASGKTESGAQVLQTGIESPAKASVPSDDPAPDVQGSQETPATHALLSAVQDNNLTEVQRLLTDGGTDLNVSDAAGETPLFEAAANGNVDIAALLLLNAADPSHRSSGGMVAGDLAADENMKTLLALFEGIKDKEEAKAAMLNALSQTIRERVVSHLQIEDDVPVAEAASGNRESDAQRLDTGMASSQKAPGEAERNAVPDARSSQDVSTADTILSAVQANDLQGVQKLLEEGTDLNVPDAAGETPLFEAAANGNLDIAALLLLHAADPAHRSSGGMVASDLAADENMKTLLALFAGVEVNDEAKAAMINALSQTIRAQVIARHSDKVDVGSTQSPMPSPQMGDASAEQSMQSSGNAPKQDSKSHEASSAVADEPTPLLLAVQANSLKEVQRLLEEGSNPNLGDALGETPLFEAAACGSIDIAATLLINGADPALKSSHGMLAADLASDDRTKALLNLFQGQTLEQSVRHEALLALSDSIRPLALAFLQRGGSNSTSSRQSGIDEASEHSLEPDHSSVPSASSRLDGKTASTHSVAGKSASTPAELSGVGEALQKPLPGDAEAKSCPHRIVQWPAVAIRKEASFKSDVVLMLRPGELVELGEWDPTGRWRRALFAQGWLPMSHLQVACTAEPTGPDPFPRVTPLGSSLQSFPGLSAAHVRSQLHAAGILGSSATESNSAAASALLEVIRGGGADSPEAKAALATLDAKTVEHVLAAALKHIDEAGIALDLGTRGVSDLPRQAVA